MVRGEHLVHRSQGLHHQSRQPGTRDRARSAFKPEQRRPRRHRNKQAVNGFSGCCRTRVQGAEGLRDSVRQPFPGERGRTWSSRLWTLTSQAQPVEDRSPSHQKSSFGLCRTSCGGGAEAPGPCHCHHDHRLKTVKAETFCKRHRRPRRTTTWSRRTSHLQAGRPGRKQHVTEG